MNTISVVICAYTEKRWNDLLGAIESIQKQTLPPQEVIVVIDHNPSLYDRTKKYFPNILVIENKYAAGSSGARNCGAEEANGEILAFIDDDAIASSTWLNNLVEGYQDPSVMGIGGQIIPLWEKARPSWFPEEFDWVVGCTYRGAPKTRMPVRNLILCNMSMKREKFNATGGFRTTIGHRGGAPNGDEETELCIRANQQWPQHKYIYEPTAVVFHHVPEFRTTVKYFFWRCFLEGNSKAILSGLVGANDSLSSEWKYTVQTLPLGIGRGIWDAISYLDPAGLARSGVIFLGLVATTWGYLRRKLFYKKAA